MVRKPFHEVILNELRELAKSVLVSAGAEKEMKLVGNIFRKAILPKDKRSEIVKALRDLASNFPNASGDTKSAQNYLEELAEDVGE
jgi:hypothetical protein